MRSGIRNLLCRSFVIVCCALWGCAGQTQLDLKSKDHGLRADNEDERDTTEPLRIVVDTDMAPDDWVAILYLAKHPNVELTAISVTGVGESRCRPGMTNALGLLALAGHGDKNIPVFCGRETPLVGDNRFPLPWRDMADEVMGIPLPEAERQASKHPAPQVLLDLVDASEGPLHILALGPLTNLAEAYMLDQEKFEEIESVTIMGGAVQVPGNLIIDRLTTPIENARANGITDPFISKNKVAEWNIYVDPVAADIVFQSTVSLTMVPLDATNSVPVSWAYFECLGKNVTNDAADFLYRMLELNPGFIQSSTWFFWDPLAAAILVEPEICAKFEETPLRIVTSLGPTQGATRDLPKAKPVRVCTAVRESDFVDPFLEVMTGVPGLYSCVEERRAVASTIMPSLKK